MNNYQNKSKTSVGNCGAITLKGLVKNARSSGRTKSDILCDLFDESLHKLMFKECEVDIKLTHENGNLVVCISDSIKDGFKGIDKEGEDNPFNACYRNHDRHNDDNEWSEHGSGFKNALYTACNHATILTKYKKQDGSYSCEEIIFDLNKMIKENRHSPYCKTVDEEYYKSKHPYKTGTTITLKDLNKSVFGDSFKSNCEDINKIVKDKYSKPLLKGNEGFDKPSRLTFQINDEPVEYITYKPTPTQDKNHPHPIYKVFVEVLTNKDDEVCLLVNEEGEGKRSYYYCKKDNKSKCASAKKKKEIKNNYPICVDVFTMEGTRTSGTDYDGHPSGSINMYRLERPLTININKGGRHMSFIRSRISNGESNYHYYELNWTAKKCTALFQSNNRKIIDCDLPTINPKIMEPLKKAQELLKKNIKGETPFHKDWKMENGIEWDNSKTYEQNKFDAEQYKIQQQQALVPVESDDETEDETEDKVVDEIEMDNNIKEKTEDSEVVDLNVEEITQNDSKEKMEDNEVVDVVENNNSIEEKTEKSQHVRLDVNAENEMVNSQNNNQYLLTPNHFITETTMKNSKSFRKSTKGNNPIDQKKMIKYVISKIKKVDEKNKDYEKLILYGTTDLKGLIKICDDCLKSLLGKSHSDMTIAIRNIRKNTLVDYLNELLVIWKDVDDNKPVYGGSHLVDLFNYVEKMSKNDA